MLETYTINLRSREEENVKQQPKRTLIQNNPIKIGITFMNKTKTRNEPENSKT